MRLSTTGAVLSALTFNSVSGIRILQSNDDGWAENDARVFHEQLKSRGHDVVLSCPAENESGSGSLDKEPTARIEPCMYDSCPPNSGPYGSNATDPSLNWVNSYPVTSARYGIDLIGPRLWKGSKPELVVAGPNTGPNLWIAVPFSGTVGIAAYAAHTAGIPAIAFSGANTKTHSWRDPVAPETDFYAKVATNITNTLINSGKPYLPKNVFLNVNMPMVQKQSMRMLNKRIVCSEPGQVKVYLTRIYPGGLSPPDVKWCGKTRLPTEFDVHEHTDCAVTISVGEATGKTTASAAQQEIVLEKLKPLLSCWEG